LDSLRLTRQQRLKKPADFQRVYKSKQWGGNQHYTFNVNAINVDAAKNGKEQRLQPTLLGVTVSKKVSKKAVDRNRIKRQIKEFFRLRQNQLSDSELVITAKPSCLTATDQQRQESLEELWSKIQKWQRWHQRLRLKTTADLTTRKS